MSLGGEALLYNCRSLDDPSAFPHFVTVPTVGRRHPKTARSMSTCMPSSSCEALRYAVAALSRLDDFNCEKIGAGFFSEVFKVTHRTTGQVMVLKMNTSLSNRANMLREVQLMNRLSHENILRFMGVCVHQGQLHALTEFINGGSLEQLLLDDRLDLSWESRIKLSLDIARGMCYLHSRGVFHRDLTSKNVLIKIKDKGMTAVVGDFGLAEKIPDPKDRSQRLPIVGSPYWMAPECLKGAWYNEKADVFSYGIILCEIIARIVADPDILPRTENFGVDYVAFSDMCPECPPQYLELAFTSCRIDPESRPSFGDVVRRLEKMLNVISAMSGGSRLFYPPVAHADSCDDDGDSIDNVRAIFAHGWSRPSSSQGNKDSEDDSSRTPSKHQQPPPVTPRHVGAAMSLRDPHYRPSPQRNPFCSLPRFWKGKKFLGNHADLAHSLDFDAPSPPKVGAADDVPPRCRKDSHSLPASPTVLRKVRQPFREDPDSPRSLSPSSFSGFSSVQERMSGCRIHDGAVPTAGESSGVGGVKTCAKLRRSSGESGFFSVDDHSSTCDLSLESCLASWTADDAGVQSRKRPSSCYSDDSSCGCSSSGQRNCCSSDGEQPACCSSSKGKGVKLVEGESDCDATASSKVCEKSSRIAKCMRTSED